MKKKDILELKKRLKKDDCTFTRMCGCYVDANKNTVLNFNQTFLNLEEEEFFKYLEIARKVLSGTLGNNILELEFPYEEETEGGKQYSLMQLKKSALKNDELLNKFYKTIIDSYDYTGNYLILIFHDAYDVLIKTTDNAKLDESEEVYEYILCAICPVSLSKPGLRYFENDNRIGARIRDWVVEAPANGFVFPAFSDRGTDVNSIMYYTKNAKDPHPELMEEALGCSSKQTAAEQKEVFTNIIRNAIGSDNEKSDHLFMEIQDSLNTMVDDYNSVNDKNSEPVVLTNNAITEILTENGVSEELTAKIEKTYTEQFGDTPPAAEYLIDSKILAANEQRKKEQRLQRQIDILQNKLDKTQQNNTDKESQTSTMAMQETAVMEEISHTSQIQNNSDNISEVENNSEFEKENTNNTQNYDVVLHVKPQKISQIKSEIIDGKKCIIIPMDENEHANVNGINTLL